MASNIIETTVFLGQGNATVINVMVPLIAAPNTNFLELWKTYSSQAALEDDRFGTGDPVYDAEEIPSNLPKKLSSFLVGRIQVDKALVTVPAGQYNAGLIFALEGADNGDTDVTDVTYTTVDTAVAASAVNTGVAGAASFEFLGDADDAELFQVDATFEYSGDTTTAANGTYTVKTAGSHLGGTVTVVVDEAIVAATADGTITVRANEFLIAESLVTAWSATALASTPLETAPADGTFTVQVSVAGDPMIVRSVRNDRMMVTPDTLGGTGATDALKWKSSLDAIKANGASWWMTNPLTRDVDIQFACSAWVQDEKKYMELGSAATAVYNQNTTTDATSIWYKVDSADYKRTRGFFSRDADGSTDDPWPEVADAAANLAYDPKLTYQPWFGKNLPGLTTESEQDTPLTDTQKANLLAKKFDYYDLDSGLRMTTNGNATSGGGGTGIDGIPVAAQQAADLLESELNAAIVELVYNKSNVGQSVPFNSKGINEVKGVLSGVVGSFIAPGFIDKEAGESAGYGPLGYQVTMPDIADVTQADKDASLLKNIKIAAIYGRFILHFNVTVSLA